MNFAINFWKHQKNTQTSLYHNKTEDWAFHKRELFRSDSYIPVWGNPWPWNQPAWGSSKPGDPLVWPGIPDLNLKPCPSYKAFTELKPLVFSKTVSPQLLSTCSVIQQAKLALKKASFIPCIHVQLC